MDETIDAPFPVFTVRVKDQVHKAVTLIDLKRFIENKKYKHSLLNIDPTKISFEESIVEHQAKAALETLAHLEFGVDLGLGLIQKDEPEVIPEPAPVKKQQPQVRRQPVEEPEIEETPEEPEELQDEEDDNIVL